MTEKPRRNRRTAASVKQDMINAVGQVLVKYGFAKLGISLVADVAKVDKNVIYRNFGNFDTLLSAYIEKQDYWLQALKEHGNQKIIDKRKFIKNILTGQLNVLFKNKELQQLLLWELADTDKLIRSIAIKREVLAEGIIAQYKELFRNSEIQSNHIAALLIAGIYYLVLHKDKSTFCHKDINIREDRVEFIKAMEWLVDAIFDQIAELDKVEKVAIKAVDEGFDIEAVSKITALSVDKIKELIASQ